LGAVPVGGDAATASRNDKPVSATEAAPANSK
jgi:hypothetical protein